MTFIGALEGEELAEVLLKDVACGVGCRLEFLVQAFAFLPPGVVALWARAELTLQGYALKHQAPCPCNIVLVGNSSCKAYNCQVPSPQSAEFSSDGCKPDRG